MNRVFIIAEAGVNHNGSLDMAKRLVEAASEAGVDAIKFQTFKTEKLVSPNAPKAVYQTQTTEKNESQFDMLKRLELNDDAHHALIDYCKFKNIQFLSTPFDMESLDLLTKQLDIPLLKFSSGDLTNAPLLLKGARTGKPIILSTGMSSLVEIEIALSVLAFGYTRRNGIPSLQAFQEAYISETGQAALQKKVVLLHCTTEYPAPFADINLRAMDTLANAFSLPVGYSDHSEGIAIPIAAVARGAVVIEKHFTLDRNLPGPDHKASLEPDQLKAMVDAIRQVEKSLGSSLKAPAPSELKNMSVARKSIVAARHIQKDEVFTEENLTVKRPGDGLAPIQYWEVLGKRAKREYEQDEKVML